MQCVASPPSQTLAGRRWWSSSSWLTSRLHYDLPLCKKTVIDADLKKKNGVVQRSPLIITNATVTIATTQNNYTVRIAACAMTRPTDDLFPVFTRRGLLLLPSPPGHKRELWSCLNSLVVLSNCGFPSTSRHLSERARFKLLYG